MPDQRKLKRRQLIYYLKVLDRETDNPVGRLVDITGQGFMLISSDPLPVHLEYGLKMHLPAEMASKDHIEFTALSLWCKKDINPDFFDTGFRFKDITPDDLRIINDLIHEFELPG